MENPLMNIYRLFQVLCIFITSFLSLSEDKDVYASEFEPGLITKIAGEYVSINLDKNEDLVKGDTLWIFREKETQVSYIGLVRVLVIANNKCGAKILFTRSGEKIEILDRAGRVPKEIDLAKDQKVGNLEFVQEIHNQIKKSQANTVSQESLHNPRNNETMPSVILFSLGSIGIGITAAYGALAMYHNYESKYADTPAAQIQHAQDYKDARKIRNIAGISSAVIISIGTISHFLNHEDSKKR